MKLFVYKTLVACFLIFVLFHLTIGYTLRSYENEIKNYFSKDKINFFKDKNNLIRRVERFYNKGEYLSLINNKFMKLINDILKLKVLIFKDKLNLKPPGGEGFKAHYDGVFFFKDFDLINFGNFFFIFL